MKFNEKGTEIMENKEFLNIYNELDKPTRIGLVLAELPRKIQIAIIKSVLKDSSLNYKERYNFSCYLLYKSTLSRSDILRIHNLRSRLLKPLLLRYYRENNKYNQSELKKMAKMSLSYLIYSESL